MTMPAPELVRLNRDLPIDMLRDLVAGFRSGQIKLTCPDGIEMTPEIQTWLDAVNAQMRTKYEAELRLRTN